MNELNYQLGLIGLGTMGRNLILNISGKGFTVAGYDRDTSKVDALLQEAGDRVHGAGSITEFVKALKVPRAVLLLVPAGSIVDSVIDELLPFLQEGDLVIDGGNSHFTDTDRRQKALEKKGIKLLGLGISGGSEGARRGPSMMPGGERQAYETVKEILEATAARVDDQPCVTYLGAGSAGHYVKMVHNGIEYGLMQLISETYDLMKRGLRLSNEKIKMTYKDWNQGSLQSFLLEITAEIFGEKDDQSDRDLIDMIADESKQKGTGKWTSQDAMNLRVPLPTVDIAVAMRDMSGYKSERQQAATILAGPDYRASHEEDRLIGQLEKALFFSYIITYAQGMDQLRAASQAYGYSLSLGEVAKIWRGGCIIRASLLEDILKGYSRDENLASLLVDPSLSAHLMESQQAIREVIQMAVVRGIPAPGMMSSLAYFDAYRSKWLPANLIQAQRDYFGAHTYERIDRKGVFHTDWQAKKY